VRVWGGVVITVYRSGPGGLQKVEAREGGCWVNVVAPTSEELHEIATLYSVPLDFLTDPLDVWERARIDRDEGKTFIVLRTAHRDVDEGEIPYRTLPIGIIFAGDVVITVCMKDVEVIRDLLGGRVKGFSTTRHTRFVLLLAMRTALLFLAYLKEINQMTNKVEKNLHRALKNQELLRLMTYEKSLVYFTTSLRSNALMFEKFQVQEGLRMTEEDRDLLDDVIVENRQAIEMANIYSSILSDMMDAFASVISNNLNVVMKLLTTVTIILMIPTLVASIYGMNIDLPFQHHPEAFAITMGGAVICCIVGILVFWRQEFL
jgi:magnesium transporter